MGKWDGNGRFSGLMGGWVVSVECQVECQAGLLSLAKV